MAVIQPPGYKPEKELGDGKTDLYVAIHASKDTLVFQRDTLGMDTNVHFQGKSLAGRRKWRILLGILCLSKVLKLFHQAHITIFNETILKK